MSDKRERRGFFATLKSGKAAAAASNNPSKDGGGKRYRENSSSGQTSTGPNRPAADIEEELIILRPVFGLLVVQLKKLYLQGNLLKSLG